MYEREQNNDKNLSKVSNVKIIRIFVHTLLLSEFYPLHFFEEDSSEVKLIPREDMPAKAAFLLAVVAPALIP